MKLSPTFRRGNSRQAAPCVNERTEKIQTWEDVEMLERILQNAAEWKEALKGVEEILAP